MIDLRNFKFKKKFGQNFIIDENVLTNLANKPNIEEDSLVIEIGCGAGALTRKLVNKAKYVIGYEIDNSLKPILDNIKADNLEIIYDDFLKRDIFKDINKYSYKNLYVIANLPYYITTPILNRLIDFKISIKKIVIMIQKEVGD
jgi:16S rRNA (adenine1518-N6/adenine1519-N6)-dimethyltransferase